MTHEVADVRGASLVHHIMMLVYVENMVGRRKAFPPDEISPERQHLVVPLDNEGDGTSSPCEQPAEPLDGILDKAEVVEVNVEERTHGHGSSCPGLG